MSGPWLSWLGLTKLSFPTLHAICQLPWTPEHFLTPCLMVRLPRESEHLDGDSRVCRKTTEGHNGASPWVHDNVDRTTCPERSQPCSIHAIRRCRHFF